MDYLMLGSLAVVDGERTPALGGLRQRAVLAVLLLSADRTVSIDALIEQVWDDAPPPKALASVRAYIANLRKILAGEDRADRLATDGYGYRLRLGDDRLDIRLFETRVGHGKRLLAACHTAGAARVLTEALALWRGSPLADFRDLPFAHHEIHRLEALRADAVEARYEADLAQGHAASLIGGLEGEVAANPLREQLWGQLMLALYRAGRRADALAAHQRLRSILDEELGVGPSAALNRLANEIRSESAELEWAPSSEIGTRGTPAARSLYGRTPELTRLRDALAAAADGCGGVAVVTGESGVGKTALAAETARCADDLGMAVVWVGHAGGVRTPPSWAWTQVLRHAGRAQRAAAGRVEATWTGNRPATRPASPIWNRWRTASPRQPAAGRHSSCSTICTAPIAPPGTCWSCSPPSWPDARC
ncbi:BTAD domain-containing putative transcriptional regulator [Mycolicibacterium insubricum]|uniref:BTAD domain-containing putative transcriptional regulator n=1 Tax=Mycolicibacterium insubricum TaxID=444597 RepID=UPI0021F2C206|nr:BTAD domain-containing putative transcriptional regulator [Mycolicibacterium insubricum]MCV7082878.1 AAA family ATPase [Mycolicibacterium insubricum]